MGKMKYIAIVVVLVLFIMIPVTMIGAVVSNPLGFIGDLIFDIGDSDKISEDIEEMYSNFTSTKLFEESTAYIDQLRKDNVKFSYKYYIIPCLLVIDVEIDQPTLENTGMDKLLKKAYEIGERETTDNEYITMLKKTNEFQKLNQLSDTTILMYINQLGGASSNNTQLPTSTEDLRLIAQGDIYIGAANPFVASGYRGQCTWWCWSRAKEVTGVIMPTSNARDWAKDTTLKTGKEPKSKSVLSIWDNGSNGRQHVIFIEDYSNGYITFSEGNIGGDGTVEYTREHYLELLRYGRMSESEFMRTRVYPYDHFKFIYTD